MERRIEASQSNHYLIGLLYQLCSDVISQTLAMSDKDLELIVVTKNSYHVKYKEIEFDFSMVKDRCDKTSSFRLVSLKFHEKYPMVKKYWTEGSTLVVGYVNSCLENSKVLNSWIEVDDENIIIDINRNLMMKKEEYDLIFAPQILLRQTKGIKKSYQKQIG